MCSVEKTANGASTPARNMPAEPITRCVLQCVASEVSMEERALREALERHWDASNSGEFEIEHEIYHEDAVLEYPQSGERIRGRKNIQESRILQPSTKQFAVQRIIGSGSLWVSEFILTYDRIPSYVVSIMEFERQQVARETQYFSYRFEPGPSRAHLVEHMT
jgi:hypothetical protein